MTLPLIQIALDYIELEPALAMAQLVADEVDVFEIGTPLTKAAGMQAVRVVRALFPHKLILADIKSPDVGGLEAKMAFDAGANFMTVMGSAAPATIRSALEEAKRQGKVAYVEMTGIRDILAAASEWKELGAEWLVYHREWDAGVAGRQWTPKDYEILKRLMEMGFKVNVAGHITVQLLSFFKGLPLSVITVGREIREAPDPVAAARQFREEIAKLWGAGATSSPTQRTSSASSTQDEMAAKAIRWAISEMGLQLVVDGRECPGCDSPRRFCLGTQTDIQCPQGMLADDVVRVLSQTLDPSGAFGRISDNAFFLDPAQLSGLSRGRVVQLLNATGSALQQLGYPVDVNAGIKAANQVLGIS